MTSTNYPSETRDLCPKCHTPTEPTQTHADGAKIYSHCGEEWGCYSPADVAPAVSMEGVNPAADPAWVAARDQAGRMTPDEARAYYAALEQA